MIKTSIAGALATLIYVGLLQSGPGHAAPDSDLSTLITWLEGNYANTAQVDTGVLDVDANLLFPIFKQVDIPAFGSHVIYLQWHIGSPDGRLQRQRIWSFLADDAGAVSMAFFTLKEPEKWRDAHLDPTKVRGMTTEDVIGYPDTCLLPVSREGRRYVMRIPSTCQIVSQSTKTAMTLQSETTIAPQRITYQEAGLREDGSVVFQVPPQGRYVFDRLLD